MRRRGATPGDRELTFPRALTIKLWMHHRRTANRQAGNQPPEDYRDGNAVLTQVGPGTPMGELMRQF